MRNEKVPEVRTLEPIFQEDRIFDTEDGEVLVPGSPGVSASGGEIWWRTDEKIKRPKPQRWQKRRS